ncbi:MAG: hypothetical protein ABIQ23_01295 [Candidatus Limnocylindria bacterium]
MPEPSVERRIPWPRDRLWRPGEPMTIVEDGLATTFLLRGVMRDTDPSSAFATVTLEPARSIVVDEDLTAELPNVG